MVYLDIYDCRTENVFYNKLATATLKQTAGKGELILRNVKEFLSRLTPRISFGADPASDMSVSLDITPKDYTPEEILQLPEKIAQKTGKHRVVCIDEFQQIGILPTLWRCRNASVAHGNCNNSSPTAFLAARNTCFPASSRTKKMSFYLFGDIQFLQPISTANWIPFIRNKFEEREIAITDEQIRKICETVQNQSSYVQQLAWNVMLNSDNAVTEESLRSASNDLIGQNSILSMQQTESLSAYQMNFLRALAAGKSNDLTSAATLKKYNLGTKSNISRLQDSLIKKELIEKEGRATILADPVFRLWLLREENGLFLRDDFLDFVEFQEGFDRGERINVDI